MHLFDANLVFFIHHPVGYYEPKINSKARKKIIRSKNLSHSHRLIVSPQRINHFYPAHEEEGLNNGAAAFLLSAFVQKEIPKILLEGGPGQGKSTISQFICQVHRAKLLNKKGSINANYTKEIPIRLPFKVDLRHVAAWVEEKNPYQDQINEEFFKKIWQNSLESFLVGHIIFHSKITDFTSSDLIAIFKNSSILIVFDGFDEIANGKIRSSVIEFIEKGINRISENAKSLQIVITSRPAAFSDSIEFSEVSYPHFQLSDITPKIINEYVENWISASTLSGREGVEIRQLVKEKLEMPHLRELTKSPMQLAIFISLLRTRGESLPHKRTALYDSYIELFFNRESEKSLIIRDNRDLIIDIHQYLAWVLHSEAELNGNNGIIGLNDLRTKLKTYLEEEGHKTDIADNLFNALEERVCAIVSRVQGTFEFEVQPLREYFCAKYLYNTSPYSPAGSSKKGTKPERFETIAKNFYWNNVVRFFAGCFDRGELPMIIDKLKELQEDPLLSYTNYPRLVTSQILSDRVFTQYPRLFKHVIKIIVSGIDSGNILNQENNIFQNNDAIILPIDGGRKEVVEECFSQLELFPNNDFSFDLINIIKNNSYKNIDYWLKGVEKFRGEELSTWLHYGYLLQLLHIVDISVLLKIIKSDKIFETERLQTVIRVNRIEIIENDKTVKESVLKGILSSSIFLSKYKDNVHSLNYLSYILNPNLYNVVFEKDYSHIKSLSNIISFHLQRHNWDEPSNTELSFSSVDEIDEKILNLKNTLDTEYNNNDYEWISTLIPWDILISNLISLYGEQWSVKVIATISAGIKSKTETYNDFSDFDNSNKSLAKRVRSARLKSGNSAYWLNLFNKNENILFKLLVFLSWATPRTILNLYELVDNLIVEISEKEYILLKKSLLRVLKVSSYNIRNDISLKEFALNAECSNRLKLLLSERLKRNHKEQVISGIISGDTASETIIKEAKIDFLVKDFFRSKNKNQHLEKIKDIYTKKDNKLNWKFHKELQFRRYRSSIIEMPIEVARKVMENAREYPTTISSIAEQVCRHYANKNTIPVGQIAIQDKWFE